MNQATEQRNSISPLWKELNNMIKKEVSIYQDLLRLEKEKTSAISERDVKKLQKITFQQEETMSKRDKAEENRVNIIKDIARNVEVDDSIHLTDLLNVPDISQENSKILHKQTKEFRNVVSGLRNIARTNRKMLDHHYNFFNSLRVSLSKNKDEIDIYDSKKSVNKNDPNSKPIFLDTNC